MMGWHWGWWLFWLVLAALVMWGLVRATRRGGGRPATPETDNAEEALRRRYAAGEIERDEFEERLKVIRKS